MTRRRAPGGGEVAAARLRDWLAAGVLAADREPALYVYEQRGRRLGAARADRAGRGRDRGGAPARGRDAGPGRRAARADDGDAGNLEPILLVYNGGAGAGAHGGTAGPVSGGTPPTALTHRQRDVAARGPTARSGRRWCPR